MPDGMPSHSFCTESRDFSRRVTLRILATTDMHMHVLPYNYIADRACERHGLARTATLIDRFRQDHPDCLLLDNGDFLQGNPMGDYVAEIRGSDPHLPHPAIAAMNALGYDAAALGNHDFNYGLRFLGRAAEQARFPLLAANLTVRQGRRFPAYTILRRKLRDAEGRLVDLNIGVIGLLPPQTSEWDIDLSQYLSCDDIVETAQRLVPLIRADGADLIVALAHSGIGPLDHVIGMEHAATAVADIDGIDVVIAGHTHQVFPGPQIAPAPGVDPQRGTLAGKPAVMAGFGGSHLGIVDLELRGDAATGWQVDRFDVRAEPVDASLRARADIASPALTAHRATRRHYRRRVGRTEAPLNSFFSLIGWDSGLRLVNLAQRWHVRNRLRGTQWQDLPVLSAAPVFRAGGRGGADHYTDVPAGTLTLRNLADLYLFPNRICAVQLTGAQLTGWLERAAGQFHQIDRNARDAPLIRPDFPSYNFDVIDGITWQVDLLAPPRFAPDGRLVNADGGRIRDLRWQNRPVAATDRFVLATSTYRLATCGLYAPLASTLPVALPSGAMTRDILRNYVRRRRRIAIPASGSFRFCGQSGASVLFETSPAAVPHLSRIPTVRHAEHTGCTDEGFALLRLHL